MKTMRFFESIEPKNLFSAFESVSSSTRSGEVASGIHSLISSKASSTLVRFLAVLRSYLSKAKLRVIVPRNDFKLLGLAGGIEFQARKSVSFTHSSASSSDQRMFEAI